jgi:ElaB/YqjD/DUF883 family membrane-anchored ribosome-binding protein
MLDRISGYIPDASGAATQIKEKAYDLKAVVREQLSEQTEAIKKFVVDHPARALGLALAMGVMLGWWIKRR